MIDNWPILSIVTFLPLAGVLFLLLIKGDEKALAQNSRFVAMWVSGFHLFGLITIADWV